MNKNLVKKIQEFAGFNGLWKPGDKIILGISGGPDSVCLLDILSKLSSKNGIEIHLAHVNYGLRGKDSYLDEKFVIDLAGRYDLPLSIYQPQVSLSKNLEEHLRQLRYEFFSDLKEKLNFDLIAVAHNLDDQAETVLMRIIRGSGTQGLRAMQPQNRALIRPLLETAREDILEYLKKNELSFRQDQTNSDPRFFRNKIRHQLLPLLQKTFNPSIKKSLSRLADSACGDYDYISNQALKLLSKIATTNGYTFKRSWFLKLHQSMRNELLRQLIFHLKNSLAGIENTHLDEIIKAISSHKSKHKIVLFKGLKLEVKNDTVKLRLNK